MTRPLTLTEACDLIARRRFAAPEPEDHTELRRRIAAHMGLDFNRFSGSDGFLEMPEHLRRATSEDWSSIRRRIWIRDGGVCHVCTFGVVWEYDCGHIIDRAVGGTDRDSNLVVMHGGCNQLKPPHRTREQYEAWLVDVVRVVAEKAIRAMSEGWAA